MKKTVFYCAIFLCCTFLGCQKKSLQPSSSSISSLKPPNSKDSFGSIVTEKSNLFPDFDLTHPVHSERKDVMMTTYFDNEYVNGSKDFWTKHVFLFGEKSLELIYHYVSENGVTNSDVYDVNGEYQFTYVDDNIGVSIVYNNRENPQQMPTGFYNCMKWYINNYYYESMVFGTPYYTYFAYKCCQNRAR